MPKISLNAVQLRAAANAADVPRKQVPMNFGDLLGAFAAQAVDHSGYMAKRYVAALGDVSAWCVTTAQLDGCRKTSSRRCVGIAKLPIRVMPWPSST